MSFEDGFKKAMKAAAPKKESKLTLYARQGFHAAPGTVNPFIATSPAFYAWKLGAHFKATGRIEPRDVRMGRGYTIWGNDMLFNADTTERMK